MKVALVLLSGGQDSTTCLYFAKHRLGCDVVHALSVYYGQRHATELAAARTIGHMAGVESHVEVDLAGLMTGGESALLLGNQNELRADGGLPDVAMPQGLPTSFVPGRNLLFLAAAAARAGAVGADVIVTGVCQTDYSGYPDCRESFVRQMQAAIDAAWPTEVAPPQIVTPLMYLTKRETVELAMSMPDCMAAMRFSVTCYRGTRCGVCPACELRAKGFAEAGVTDPAYGVAYATPGY